MYVQLSYKRHRLYSFAPNDRLIYYPTLSFATKVFQIEKVRNACKMFDIHIRYERTSIYVTATIARESRSLHSVDEWWGMVTQQRVQVEVEGTVTIGNGDILCKWGAYWIGYLDHCIDLDTRRNFLPCFSTIIEVLPCIV